MTMTKKTTKTHSLNMRIDLDTEELTMAKTETTEKKVKKVITPEEQFKKDVRKKKNIVNAMRKVTNAQYKAYKEANNLAKEGKIAKAKELIAKFEVMSFESWIAFAEKQKLAKKKK